MVTEILCRNNTRAYKKRKIKKNLSEQKVYTSNTLLPRFQLNKKELDIFMQILFVLEIKTKYDKNLKFILSIIVISKLPRRLLAALGSRERKSLFHLKQFLLNAPRKTKIYRKTITLGGRTVRNWKKKFLFRKKKTDLRVQ